MESFVHHVDDTFTNIAIKGSDIVTGPHFLSNLTDKVIEYANKHYETKCFILKVHNIKKAITNEVDKTSRNLEFIFMVEAHCSIISLKPKQLIVCKVDEISITKSLKVSNVNINCIILESHIDTEVFSIGKDIVHKKSNTVITKESFIIVEVKEVNYNIPEGQISVWGLAVDIPTQEQIDNNYFSKTDIMKKIIEYDHNL